jgi:hypothetical protein
VRVVALVLGLGGCALCHAPRKPDVPAGIEVSAFIDQREECWTIEMRPGADLVLTALVSVLRIFAGGG